MNEMTLYQCSTDGYQQTRYGQFNKEEIKELKINGWGLKPCEEKKKQYNKNGILIEQRTPYERR
ncbi:hypothetical protein [Viridibacillus arvi]|uniref:hypothetical protein n=1 Tax=Viridibacillus arvi TaxID=263475 RepID=UPI0034CF227F